MKKIYPEFESYPLLLNPQEAPPNKVFGRFDSLFMKSPYYSYSVPRSRSIFCKIFKYSIITLLLIGIMTITAFILRPFQNPHKPMCNKAKIKQDGVIVSVHMILNNGSWNVYQVQKLEEIVRHYSDKNVQVFAIRLEEPKEKLKHDLEFCGKNTKDDGNITFHCKVQTFFKNAKKNSKHYFQKVVGNNRNWYRQKYINELNTRNKQQILDFIKTPYIIKRERYSPKIKTINELIKEYPRVQVFNITFEEIFLHSFLKKSWKLMDLPTAFFAARVIKLWEIGGINFEIFVENFDHSSHNKCTSKSDQKSNTNVPVQKSKTLIDHKSSDLFVNSSNEQFLNLTLKPLTNFFHEIVLIYKNLSQSTNNITREIRNITVSKFERLASSARSHFDNSDDDSAVVDSGFTYMIAKHACHEFLGDLILRLTDLHRETNLEDVLNESLSKYCVKAEKWPPNNVKQ